MFSSVTSSHFRRICAHFTATWRSWRSLGGPRRAERESPEFIAIDQHQYDFKMVFVLTPQISPEQNSSSQMATLQARTGSLTQAQDPGRSSSLFSTLQLEELLVVAFLWISVFPLCHRAAACCADPQSRRPGGCSLYGLQSEPEIPAHRNNKSCRGGGKLQGWLRLL